MRILSQNRKSFAILENTDGISISSCKDNSVFMVTAIFNEHFRPVTLGEYKSEARAAEVLMSIFDSKADTFMMPEE